MVNAAVLDATQRHEQSPALQHELQRYRQALLTSLMTSAAMVEARDPYTGGHLWRVARFSMTLAEHAGLDALESIRIGIAGFLHDIGKIAIPDAVLRKPGKLTDDEFAVIKTHPDVGASMLAGHPLAALVEPAVLWHHEMPNGRGYPQQLRGDAIPLDARIVGICDAFDAMTSTRPYRAGMPIEKALEIIEQQLGEQFDATLGRLFIDLGRAGAWQHIVGHSDDGIPLGVCPACGPTLVRTQHTVDGETVTCPACFAQLQWQQEEGPAVSAPSIQQGRHWRAVPTGQRALFAVAQPDPQLINQLVQRWAALKDL